MSSFGLRKTALYLASLDERERDVLTSGLPSSAVDALQPLVAEVVRQGWCDPDLVGRALAEDLRGLTTQSALPAEALSRLAKRLPSDWIARVFAANPAFDRHFLVALLEQPVSRHVWDELKQIPKLPEKLREAILAEAAELDSLLH